MKNQNHNIGWAKFFQLWKRKIEKRKQDNYFHISDNFFHVSFSLRL